jgi:hypothetical protein
MGSKGSESDDEIDYELIPFDGKQLGRAYILRRVEDSDYGSLRAQTPATGTH